MSGHWKAGRWFGREHADAYEVDGDGHGGMVAKSGRWFSESWWDAHHLGRNRVGEWSRHGHERRVAAREQAATDYRAYLESRHDAAESACRGVMVSPAGERRGITGRHFFSGRPASLHYASEELRDWFHEHGRNLTASQYAGQAHGHAYAMAGAPY